MDNAQNAQSEESLETRDLVIARRATVTFDRTRTNIPELQQVVAKSGYRADAVEP